MKFSYTAYGLGISSEIELPELIYSDTTPDVFIRNGHVGIPFMWRALDYAFDSVEDGMLMYWKGVGSLHVKNGNEIVVALDQDPEVSRLRLFLLGAALGTTLHQRGLPVFHASAVSIEGRAALFVGDKGWGKSTMAAYLHKRGHKILSDDVVALMPNAGGFDVLPAFPQLKLWPDALESLGENPEALPIISSLFDKRHRGLDKGFGTTPCHLEKIYLLGRGPSVEISGIGGQEALIHLMRNLYVARFGDHVLKPHDVAHFIQCSEIVKNVSAFTLHRPPSLALMEEIAALVEKDVLSGSEIALTAGAA